MESLAVFFITVGVRWADWHLLPDLYKKIKLIKLLLILGTNKKFLVGTMWEI